MELSRTTLFKAIAGISAAALCVISVGMQQGASQAFGAQESQQSTPDSTADPQDLKYEAENLFYLSNTPVNQYDDGASNGGWIKSIFENTDDYIGFYVNAPEDLTRQYKLRVGYRSGTSRGTFDVSADDTSIGTLDQYASSSAFTSSDMGTISFDHGGAAYITFTLTGKNSASTGYDSGIDYIQLVATDAANGNVELTQVSTGTTYYVSNDGDDSASGTSPSTAWKSVDKVNQAVGFGAGSKILFERGGQWENQTLAVRGNGSASDPLVIGAYGDGSKPQPKFKGNGQVNDTLYLHNQSYVTIEDLDVSNSTPGFTGKEDGMTAGNAEKVGDFRAIHITGDNQTSTSQTTVSAGVVVKDSTIHDVSGIDTWINALSSTDALSKPSSDYPGAFFSTGWDFSKRTGGIEAETAGGTGPAVFADMTVDNNTITNVSFGGFTLKQWDGVGSSKKWAQTSRTATAPEYSDSNFHPHSNITVTDNTIDQTGQYNGDGIYVTSSTDVTISGNWVKQPGVCGIELYFVNGAVVENNEVFESMRKAGGGDSNAMDPDRHTTNTIFQYNYVHDNGDGVLICGFAYNSTIFRYNVFKDNKEIWVRDSVGEVGGFVGFYNNILLNTLDTNSITFANSNSGGGSADTWEYRNNIFVNTSDQVTSTSFGSDNAKNSFDTNVFWGPGVSTKGTNALNVDPKFKDLETGKQLGSGTDAHHRVFDFSSLELAEDSPLRYISGWNYSAEDHAQQIVKQTNGLDYAGGPVIDGSTTIGLFNVAQSTLRGTGTVSGTVKDEQGNGVLGATVTLDEGEAGTKTTTTQADGTYTLTGVQAGFGREVSVSHPNYYGTQYEQGLTILPDTTTTVDVTLRTKGVVDTMKSESFNEMALGDFTGDDYWGVYGATDNIVEIVNDPKATDGETTNRVLHIKRNTGKVAVYNKNEANWSGRFVISAKVLRAGGSNQYGIYTYHKSGWNTSDPTASTNPEATIALQPTQILTHNQRGSSATVKAADYEDNTWAQVDIVLDWGTGTFDYWVNGVKTLADQPLRTWAGDMDYLSIFSTDGTGDFYVDDINVYHGAPDYDRQGLDVSDLRVLVDAVSGFKEDDYTADSWVPFEQALSDAEEVLNDADSTQELVDSSVKSLTEAVKGLRIANPQPSVSTAALKAFVDATGELDAETYTSESWQAFQTALNKAKDVLEAAHSGNASQDDVDQAASELADAWASLKTNTSGDDKPVTVPTDGLVVKRGNHYHLKNSLAGGEADTVIAYGKASDTVLVGDWDGDGKDTLAVKRGNQYYLKNSLSGGQADTVIVYGKASDTVLVGDWDGDGKDTLAVKRGNQYYLKNSLSGGQADQVIVYGTTSDTALVGDWDGDGKDTLAVRRGNAFYIKNSLKGGTADKIICYGKPGDTALSGNWKL